MSRTRGFLLAMTIVALTTAGCAAAPSIPDDEVTCAQWAAFDADRRQEFAKTQVKAEVVPTFDADGATMIPREDGIDAQCKIEGEDSVISTWPILFFAFGSCSDYLMLSAAAQSEWSTMAYSYNSSAPPPASADRVAALANTCQYELAEDPAVTIDSALGSLSLIAQSDPALYESIIGAQAPGGGSPTGALSFTWSTESQLGYRTETVFSFDVLKRSGAHHPADPIFTLGSACTFDPKVDAWIAATVRSTNTSEGFSSDAAAAYRIETGSGAGGVSAEVETNYSAGPTCSNAGETMTGHSVTDLPPGGAASTQIFIILHDYFSPAQPDGAVASLAAIRIVAVAPSVPDDPIHLVQPAQITLEGAAGP